MLPERHQRQVVKLAVTGSTLLACGVVLAITAPICWALKRFAPREIS